MTRGRSAAEFREVRADLAEELLCDAGADAGNLGKVDAKDRFSSDFNTASAERTFFVQSHFVLVV